MKLLGKIVGIILALSLCGNVAFAEEFADMADKILADVNSATGADSICRLIEEGQLDNLCHAINGYEIGCDDPMAAAEFVFNGKTYDSCKVLADIYTAACIVNKNDRSILRANLENGFLIEVLGLDAQIYQKVEQKNLVLEKLSRNKYTSAEEFRAEFVEVYKSLESNTSSGGSGGGGGFADAAGIFETDGTPADKIIDGNKYIIRYYGSAEGGAFAAAVYSGNKLKGVAVTDFDCDKQYSDVCLELENGDTVKAFLWESIDNMIPKRNMTEIDVSSYKPDISTGILIDSINGAIIEYTDSDGNVKTENFAAAFPTYKYLGHRVKVTSCKAYLCTIEDIEEYESVLLNYNDIDSFSLTEIVSGEKNYPISESAVFCLDGVRYSSIPYPDEEYEILLSRRSGSDKWENVSIMNFRTGVVEYIGDMVYFENGSRLSFSDYTDFVSDSDMTVGSVVSYCHDVKAYVSNKKVYGKAEFADNGIVIDGVEYKAANISAETIYDYYTAYLSTFGRIEKIVPDLSVYKTSLIVKSYEEDGVVYAETADGEKISVPNEFIFFDEHHTAADLPVIMEECDELYARFIESDGAAERLITRGGTTQQMTAFGGLLKCGSFITDSDTECYIFGNGKYRKTTVAECKFPDNGSYSCTLFFDESDNTTTPICVVIGEYSVSARFIADKIDAENKTVSGYIDGKYMTFKADETLLGAITPFSYGIIGRFGDEALYYRSIGILGENPVGTVKKVTDKYIIAGEYNPLIFAKNLNVYIFDGSSIERASISDIVADPNGQGYGSYILYIDSGDQTTANNIVLRK